MADEFSKFDKLLKDKKFWDEYERSIEHAARSVFEDLCMAGIRAAEKLGKKSYAEKKLFTFDEAQALSEKVIRSYLPSWIKGITQTTQDRIKEAVITARREGSGTQGVLDTITSLFSPDRAKVIAITETTRLFGQGAQAVYRAQEMEKWQWNTAEDPWVDSECSERNGKSYGIDEEFEPAHPNCRCWPSPVA